MSVVIFLGPPGSGKGTQTLRIAKVLGLPVIATGDLLRAEVSRETDLGMQAKTFMNAGQLVPDQLIIDMMQKRLSGRDCAQGVMLDGFPRTLSQAKALAHAGIQVDHVINLDVADAAIIERMQGRRIHPASGRSYHVIHHPPKVEGQDDETGEPLILREDDRPETVQARLDVYHKNTKPLIAYYQSLEGAFHHINGEDDADQITQAILNVLR